MGQSHPGRGPLQQPRWEGAGLVQDVGAGIGRGINLENIEEGKIVRI